MAESLEGIGRNADAIVENPLRNLDGAALTQDVEDFAKAIGFDEHHLTELQRGAAVAKYANIADGIANGRVPDGTAGITLNEDERAAIRNEKNALFKQSRDMYVTVIVCACAALVQGWDQTGTNGANLYWPWEFKLYQGNDKSTISKWEVGLVNAAPYLSAALIGCILVDPLNHYLGRRGAIFFAAVWCFASVIGAAGTRSWEGLFASRLCLGVGMGAKASTVPIFAAENAPSYWRGSIVMCWQLWVASGILLGFSANLIVSVPSIPQTIVWRLQLGSALIPAIPLLILVYLTPESPRWYMKRHTAGNYRKAFKSLKRLRNTELQAYRDFYFMFKQLQIEENDQIRDSLTEMQDGAAHGRSALSFSRFIQLFSRPRIRRATLAAGTVMLSQQLCGINVLAFYSSTLFAGIDDRSNGSRLNCTEKIEQSRTQSLLPRENTAISPYSQEMIRNALLYSWAFGLINTIFALPAVKTIDTFGRRPLLLFSVSNMAWTMLGAAVSFQISECRTALRHGVIGLFLFLFAAFYSPGQGPVPFAYSAESFPLSHREAGMGFSVAVNLFFAGVLTATFPSINGQLQNTGSLGLFAGLNLLALVLIFLFVPETRQKTLEELTDVFGKRTRDQIRHQTFEVLPHYTRRTLHYACNSQGRQRNSHENTVIGNTSLDSETRPQEKDIGRSTTTTNLTLAEVGRRPSDDSQHA